MNKKILIILTIFNLCLYSCGGEGIAVGNPNSSSGPDIEGKELRITPSSSQGISFFFEFEFLEDSQLSVDIIDKNDESNILEQQNISYSQDDNIVTFEITYENDLFNFIVTLLDNGDLSNVEVVRNEDEINISFLDTTEDS